MNVCITNWIHNFTGVDITQSPSGRHIYDLVEQLTNFYFTEKSTTRIKVLKIAELIFCVLAGLGLASVAVLTTRTYKIILRSTLHDALKVVGVLGVAWIQLFIFVQILTVWGGIESGYLNQRVEKRAIKALGGEAQYASLPRMSKHTVNNLQADGYINILNGDNIIGLWFQKITPVHVNNQPITVGIDGNRCFIVLCLKHKLQPHPSPIHVLTLYQDDDEFRLATKSDDRLAKDFDKELTSIVQGTHASLELI